MPYLKCSISLRDLNEILENQPEIIKTSRAGQMYLPINIDISHYPTMYGNNVILRAYKGRQDDKSIEKGPILGYGQVDIEKLKDELER